MARVVIAQLRLKGFFYHVLPKKSLCFNLTIVETFTNCYKPQILHISLMINRQQKFLSSSFLIILALARSILFIIHMISDALKLKHKALFLSQCKALEREKEGAQGTMGITNIILHGLIVGHLVCTWRGRAVLVIWRFYIFFFCSF